MEINHKGEYLDVRISGNALSIKLTDKGSEMVNEFFAEDSLVNMTYEEMWDALLEDQDCIDVKRVNPEDIGALTDSVILSWNHGTENAKYWWYQNYQVVEPLLEAQKIDKHHRLHFDYAE